MFQMSYCDGCPSVNTPLSDAPQDYFKWEEKYICLQFSLLYININSEILI
jgi:hypothetical protein